MTPETEVAELKRRVAELERKLAALSLRSEMLDPTRRFSEPNGFVEIAIGGSPAKFPYFAVE